MDFSNVFRGTTEEIYLRVFFRDNQNYKSGCFKDIFARTKRARIKDFDFEFQERVSELQSGHNLKDKCGSAKKIFSRTIRGSDLNFSFSIFSWTF